MKQCENKDCSADGIFYVHNNDAVHIYCHKHYKEYIEWKKYPKLEVVDE